MNRYEQGMMLEAMVEQIEAMSKDPETSEKDKVSMLSSLLLAVLRSELDAQQRAMLPMIINVTMMQVKMQFAAMPKDQIVPQYDALLEYKLSPEMVGAKFDEIVSNAREQYRARYEGREAYTESEKDSNLTRFDMDRYNFDACREMGEDEYVEFSLGLQSFFPARLVAAFMQDVQGQPLDLEARARARHAQLLSYDCYDDYVQARGGELLCDELVQESKFFVMDFVQGLDGEKLHGVLSDLLQNIEAHQAIKLCDTGITFAEEFLEAGQRGNLYRFEDGKKATAFRDSAAEILQIFEDAVVDAGLVPETNFPQVYAKARDAVEERMRDAKIVQIEPSNPNLKAKGKGKPARGLKPKR
jgi:hypothetical protein